VLVICGDFRPNAAMKEVRRRFGGIPSGVPFEEVDPYRPPLLEPRAQKRILTRWDDDARRLCVGWPTAKVGTDEDYALDLVTVVLTSGRLSRLHRRLVLDEGLAVNISSSNDTRVDGGAWWMFAEAAAGVAPETLEAAIDEELERLRRDLIPARELNRARAILASSEAYESETATDLAEELGEFAVDADWRLALQGRERLAAIRPRFVREVVRRFLVDERRVLGWSLPREEA
jgi:zinc protease